MRKLMNMRGWRGGVFRPVGTAAPTAPAAINQQVFVESGTFTPPAGKNTIVVIKITAAGSASGVFGGGTADGGGGGAYSDKRKTLTIGQTVDVLLTTSAGNVCTATVAGAVVCSAENANSRTGGPKANGVGDTKTSGGNGGNRDGLGGGGGGGAGTASGDGGVGGDAGGFGGAGGSPGGGQGANPGVNGGNASANGAGAGGRTSGVAGTPGAPSVTISY